MKVILKVQLNLTVHREEIPEKEKSWIRIRTLSRKEIGLKNLKRKDEK